MEATTTRPIDETWEDTKNLVYKIVYSYRRNHGGDLDEMIGLGHEAFMAAYKSWQPGKGMIFTSYLATCVLRRLMDNYRVGRRHRMPQAGPMAAMVPDTRGPITGFDLAEFAANVSDDARRVIELTLETPAELAAIAAGKGGSPCNLRSSLRAWLIETGWTVQRVRDTFAEVGAALVN